MDSPITSMLKRILRESLSIEIGDRSNDPYDNKLEVRLLLDGEVISKAEITDPDNDPYELPF